MKRKWTILGASLAAFTLAVAGLSLAEEEKGPLHEIMEKVGPRNNAINKAVRTPVAWAKGGKKSVEDAEELIKLFKESKAIKTAAEKQKKPVEAWEKLNDDQIKALEEYIEVAKKDKQADAKKSFEAVKKVCADCHKDFRVEDE